MRSSSGPSTASSVWSINPSSRATATAVSLWSPVIITVRIPARRQRSIDFFASGRGGSDMAMSPAKVNPVSADSSTGPSWSSSRQASARTLNAWPANFPLARSTPFPCSGPNGILFPWTRMDPQRSRMMSGAPLTKRIFPSLSGDCLTTLMRLRSESNGTSPARGYRASRASFLRPALAAATIKAPSVGSPIIFQAPSNSFSCALLHKTETFKAIINSG